MNMQDDTIFEGFVVWFRGSFGFAEYYTDGIKQKDIFLYYSYISNVEGYKTLQKGQKISFKLGKNDRGELIAVNINVLKD